jgi:hypothetical protein
MKLEDFTQGRRDARPVYSLPIEAGDSRYELAISGPTALVKRVFAKADIEVRIDPAGTQKTFDKELKGLLRDEKPPTNLSIDEMEAGFAKKAPEPTLARSVLMSLRRIEGDGTFFFLAIGGFVMPARVSIFLTLPPSIVCQAIVRPTTGDQDVRLWLAWPPGFGPVSSSTRGGTATDMVTFGPFPFGPIVELAGWTTGICGAFTVLSV